jgi:DNA topoisomerase-1
MDEPLLLHEVLPEQRFTEPPPHFTESSLIKELEKRGIGRPSTYASIVRTLLKREYVHRAGKSFLAQPLGFVVCDFLVEQFPDLFAIPFTADLEEDLDRIARGERSRVEVLRSFYGPFAAALDAAQRAARSEIITVGNDDEVRDAAEETCPECGGDVVVRKGKYGRFKGCARFPRCRWTSSLENEKDRDQTSGERGADQTGSGGESDGCPQCGGKVLIRKGKYGRFRSCSNYPRCEWSGPLVVGTCPKCGGDLLERRGKMGIFWGCSNYPECRHRQRPAASKRQETPET